MDRDRIRTALGFAMRAGKCVSGDFATEQAVKKRRALAVVLDEGVSINTAQRYGAMCERMGVPLYRIDGLGRCIGKDNRMVAAVTEAGFAEMMERAAKV